MNLELDDKDKFYKHHLSGVSRSFAACIARLNQPLRNYVGLTYLVCRALDSIEDGLWKSKHHQNAAFKLFSKAVNEGVLPKIEFSEAQLPSGISQAERELLREAPRLIGEMKAAPENVRQIILRLVNSMSLGMQHFVSKNPKDAFRLSSLEEVNRYCYFVAGVVGEALTALVYFFDRSVELNSGLVRDAQHFGLFLQKVNILKDQTEDEKNGRFLVPSRIELFNSLQANTLGAWRYIQSLPESQNDYKVFCAWSFFVGLKTLPSLKEQSEAPVKLPRETTVELFSAIEKRVLEKSGLQDLFDELYEKVAFDTVPEAETKEANSKESRWFLQNYQKVLNEVNVTPNHLRELSFGL